METIKEYLNKAIEHDATDVFIIAGKPVSLKINNKIIEIENEERLLPEKSASLITKVYELAGRKPKAITGAIDDDFSFSVNNLGRFRASILKQRGSIGAVIRIIKTEIPNYANLEIPEQIINSTSMDSGLIVICGLSGKGKSMTAASILDYINKNMKKHILTIENPIEYIYKNGGSLVTQREVSNDTSSTTMAMKSAFRQSPNVVYVDNLEEPEHIRLALQLSESGYLVLTTMKTFGISNTVRTLIDAFPVNEAGLAKMKIIRNLKLVVTKSLVNNVRGTITPLYSYAFLDKPIKDFIIDDKIGQIEKILEESNSNMQYSMLNAIKDMYNIGEIDEKEYEKMLERYNNALYEYRVKDD